MKFLSWNVNGIRAIEKKGFRDWLLKENPDILGIQEIKAKRDQIPDSLLNIDGYTDYWNPAERKGYSGVGAYTKIAPLSIEYGFGEAEFDSEGRTLRLEFDDFFFYTIYFPNGQRGQDRLDYKMAFYESFLNHIKTVERETGKGIILCGDVNTAHKAIDLARPKENENVSGFLQIEREWIDKLIQNNYIDTFRQFIEEGENYSWWNYRTRARERNVGWRIDYFFVSENLKDRVKSAFILDDVYGSDHCPVGIEFE